MRISARALPLRESWVRPWSVAGRHQDVNTTTGDVPQIHRGKCDSEVSSADGVEEG